MPQKQDSKRDREDAVIEAAKVVAIANGKPKAVDALKVAVIELDPEIGGKIVPPVSIPA